MKKKIICIFVLAILLTGVFGGATTAKNVNISEKNNNYEKDLPEFKYKTNDIDIKPADVQSYNLTTLQNPLANTDSRTYKPPWDLYVAPEEEYKEGICDAWADNILITPEYSKSFVHSWAGPGYGFAYLKKWLIHGFLFCAPKSATYTLTFHYHVKGDFDTMGTEGFTPGYDQLLNDVTTFFGVYNQNEGTDVYISRNILHNELVIVDDHPFDEEFTKTLQVYLKEGMYYTVNAQCSIYSRTLAIYVAAAFAHTKVDIAELTKIEIQWPNKGKTADGERNVAFPGKTVINTVLPKFLKVNSNISLILRYLTNTAII